jgi:hypothetical protein
VNPIVKKSIVAIGAKKAFDKINEKRNSTSEKKSRFGKFLLIGGLVGAFAYALNSGKLQPLIDKVRGESGGSPASSNGSGRGGDVTLGERSLSSPVA